MIGVASSKWSKMPLRAPYDHDARSYLLTQTFDNSVTRSASLDSRFYTTCVFLLASLFTTFSTCWTPCHHTKLNVNQWTTLRLSNSIPIDSVDLYPSRSIGLDALRRPSIREGPGRKRGPMGVHLTNRTAIMLVSHAAPAFRRHDRSLSISAAFINVSSKSKYQPELLSDQAQIRLHTYASDPLQAGRTRAFRETSAIDSI